MRGGLVADDLANQHRLGGYTTTDLRASYAFASNWKVEARLANAFDRDYETAYYFNQPGRSAKNSWPHPVIANGRLYLRDQDVLLCYDIKGK